MDASNLANVVGALASLVSDRMAATVPAPDRPLPEATALALVATYPDCSIEELRGPLGLSHSGCVRLVDRLVDGELLERRAGVDGRTVGLRVTRRGRAAAAEGWSRREESLVGLLAVLEPEERRVLGRIATKLLSHGAPTPRAAGRTCRLCDHRACTECPFIHLGQENA